MKVKEKEIRRRFPRIVMNLIIAIIFWIISVYIPPTLRTITVPGIGIEASLLVWVFIIVVMGIFLIRALSDALVLGDILADLLASKLGIKEERSPKRAAREFAYIIIVVLVVTAISPFLATFKDYGYYLTIAVTYIGLGLIIFLIYDIGRIIHMIIEEKAESFAHRWAQRVQKNKNSE